MLEPEGTVEIKFRRKELLKTMRRLDPLYAGLTNQLGEEGERVNLVMVSAGHLVL